MEEQSRQSSGGLAAMFRDEGSTMIDALADLFKRLQERGYDDSIVAAAFRHAHSMKSEASFLGYDEVAESAHAVEGALNRLRNSPEDFHSESLDGATAAFLALEKAFRRMEAAEAADTAEPAGIGAAEGRQGDEELIGSGARLPEPVSEEETGPLGESGLLMLNSFERSLLYDARERGEALYYLACSVSAASVMPFARIYLVLSNLEQGVNVVKIHPSPEVLRSRGLREFECLFTTDEAETPAHEATNVDEVDHVAVTPLEYDTVLRRSEETVAGDKSPVVPLRLNAREYERVTLYAGQLSRQLAAAVETEGDDEEARARGFAILARIAREIERSLAAASRVSLRSLFYDLAVRSRKLVASFGKDVEVESHCTTEYIDVGVAGLLADALVHLVRNAVDHGIEDREERSRLGKTPRGHVRIIGGVEAGRLVIRVGDDGRGIEADGADPAAVLDRISAPGYTTGDADPNSGRSGRGVGLDVVRHTIVGTLGGAVDLETTPGKGSEFIVALPLGIRLVSVLTCRDARSPVGFPSSMVIETLMLSTHSVSVDAGGRVFVKRGTQLHAVHRIGGAILEEGEIDSLSAGVVLRFAGKTVVLAVAEIIGEESVVHEGGAAGLYWSPAIETEVEVIYPYSVVNFVPED